MEVRLKVLVGKNAGQELPLPGPTFLIGRAEDCQLRPASDLISRHHCVLLIEDDYFAVRDFGSKNGTLVNDARVAGECELKAGDKLVVGPLHFEVIIKATTTAAKKRPPVQSIKEAAVRTAASDDTQDLEDVGEWLTSGGLQGDAAAAGETRRLTLNETNEISAEGLTDSAAAPEAEEADPHKKTTSGKHKPGKLPPVPKHSKRDSREAAADVLNKFFRRR